MLKATIGQKFENSFCQSVQKHQREREREKKERQLQSILHYMQMQLEEKDRSIILKDYFSLRTDPFIFTSMALELLNQSYKTS